MITGKSKQSGGIDQSECGFFVPSFVGAQGFSTALGAASPAYGSCAPVPFLASDVPGFSRFFLSSDGGATD
jgi:hypothetical protein